MDASIAYDEGMKRVLLATLLACTGPEPEPEPTPDVRWRLEPVFDLALASPEKADTVWRSSRTDWVYLWSREDATLFSVNAAYLQPLGTYCVGATNGAGECLGTLLSPGRIDTSETTAVCPDQAGESATLVQRSGTLLRVGTTRADETWLRFHRAHEPASLDGVWGYPLNGPCLRVGDTVVLALDDHIALLALEGDTYTIRASWEVTSPVEDLAWLEDTLWTLHADGVLARTDVLSLESETVARGVRSLAADPGRGGLAWLDEEGHPSVIERATSSTTSIPTADWEHVSLDTRTGHLHLLRATESGWRAAIADTTGVLAEATGLGTPERLVPAGELGDLTVLHEGSDGLSLTVLEAVPDTPTRPPLHVFAMSTLEQPFDDADRPCDSGEDPFDAYLQQLRDNAAVLEDLPLRLAIGVTREFLDKARDCGDEAILDDLAAAGFELGVMTHGRPCYSCTDGDVEGLETAFCFPDDPDYAPPGSPDACWPDDPEYCAPGDQVCWEAWIAAEIAVVDSAIPGGGRFVHGMDRHALWGFDWVEGLRDIPRADGRIGFDTTLFAGGWSYPQLQGADDPRGKDPLPWTAEGIGTIWRPAWTDELERDSAFSDLAYLPGNSVATIRVAEWLTSGLTVLQTNSAIKPQVLDEDDFEALSGLLHQAIARRRAAPGTWYFHLRDLTTWPLERDNETIGGGERLRDWVDAIETRWGARGTQAFVWSSPSEARAAYRSASP